MSTTFFSTFLQKNLNSRLVKIVIDPKKKKKKVVGSTRKQEAT